LTIGCNSLTHSLNPEADEEGPTPNTKRVLDVEGLNFGIMHGTSMG